MRRAAAQTGFQRPFDLTKRIFHNPQGLVVCNNLLGCHICNISDHTEIAVPHGILGNSFFVEGKVLVVVQPDNIPLIGGIGDKLFGRDLFLR